LGPHVCPALPVLGFLGLGLRARLGVLLALRRGLLGLGLRALADGLVVATTCTLARHFLLSEVLEKIRGASFLFQGSLTP
jgi:hypothetical protein